MQFALLGDHPDGLDLAQALVETGRHQLSHYCGPASGAELLARWELNPQREGDVEAVLADPSVAAVIVSGKLSSRPAQLRRALQSERHVLCVHPADASPDIAYETAMIQGDTGRVLFPILPEALHPAFARLSDLLSAGEVRLIEMERWFTDDIAADGDDEDIKPWLPGWDVLRRLGGDIGEVSALAPGETMEPGHPLVVCGQFTRGGMFQAAYLPRQSDTRWRISAVTETHPVHLLFESGWPGPATLSWTDALGQSQRETWEAWNPWPSVVAAFESALLDGAAQRPPISQKVVLPDKSEHVQSAKDWIPRSDQLARTDVEIELLAWNQETRALELDDAVRRSVAKRRTSVLEFQEVTEEATFKGTMTLVGCSIIWISLMLLILSTWLPWLAWIIVPVFVLFLFIQIVFRGVVRQTPDDGVVPDADSD